MTNTAPAFVESEHPRAADGAFTDKPQTSPEVGLAPTAVPVSEEEVSRLFKAVEDAGLRFREARADFDVAAVPVSEEEVSRLFKAVEDAGLRFREARADFDVAAAKHAAAAILAELPSAVRMDLDESDQSGWNWNAGNIYDADGAVIGDGYDFDLVDLYTLPDEVQSKTVVGPDGAISSVKDERYSWLTFDEPAFRGGSYDGHIDLRAAYAA